MYSRGVSTLVFNNSGSDVAWYMENIFHFMFATVVNTLHSAHAIEEHVVETARKIASSYRPHQMPAGICRHRCRHCLQQLPIDVERKSFFSQTNPIFSFNAITLFSFFFFDLPLYDQLYTIECMHMHTLFHKICSRLMMNLFYATNELHKIVFFFFFLFFVFFHYSIA